MSLMVSKRGRLPREPRRKPDPPPAPAATAELYPPIYVRQWRKKLKGKSVRLADVLGIERESYLRLERVPHKFSVGELCKLAAELELEPYDFFRPPPETVDHKAPREPGPDTEALDQAIGNLMILRAATKKRA